MEETIRDILQDSLKCNPSFDNTLFQELDSFDFLDSISSNDIATANASYSTNVEEGASSDIKLAAGIFFFIFLHIKYDICVQILYLDFFL